MAVREPVLTAAEVSAFLDEVFPQVRGRFEIEALEAMRARVRVRVGEADLRPGDTLSGPTMFLAADVAFYIAVLAMIGREALTVTTNAAIDFMRKPAPEDLLAEARILTLGRTLAVGDVLLFSPGASGPVAHANMTYAIPPAKAAASSDARPAPPRPIERPRPPRPLRRSR